MGWRPRFQDFHVDPVPESDENQCPWFRAYCGILWCAGISLWLHLWHIICHCMHHAVEYMLCVSREYAQAPQIMMCCITHLLCECNVFTTWFLTGKRWDDTRSCQTYFQRRTTTHKAGNYWKRWVVAMETPNETSEKHQHSIIHIDLSYLRLHVVSIW